MQIVNNIEQLWQSFLPYGVFFAPIVQVSLMTMRQILVSRGIKYVASLLSFFEMSIWLFAMTYIFSSMNNWQHRSLYAFCFACGVLLGSALEERLSLGIVNVQFILQEKSALLIKKIAEAGFGVTQTSVDGVFGKGILVLSVVPRKHAEELIALIQKFNPAIFYWVEDIRFLNSGHPLFWKPKIKRNIFRSFIPGMS